MKIKVLSPEEIEIASCLHDKICKVLELEDVAVKIQMQNISVFSSHAKGNNEVLFLGKSISDNAIRKYGNERFLIDEQYRNTKMLRTMINTIIKNKNIFTSIHILNNFLYCSLSFRFEEEQIFLDLWLGSVLYGKEGMKKSFEYINNTFISLDDKKEEIDSFLNLTNKMHHKLFDEYRLSYRDIYERRNDKTIFEYSLGLS